LKKELRRERRRRYKKMEKRGLFLSIKMALICYLAIFGISYMTSDTSAFYSDQSNVSQVITAGIWEDPEEANECGDEDAISDNEINVDCENEEEDLNIEKETETENIEPKESEDKSDDTDIEKEEKVEPDAGKEEENQNPEEDETNTAGTKEEKTKKTEGDTNDEEESNVE
jgi:YqxM protein